MGAAGWRDRAGSLDPGTRTVISSVLVAKGVFSGVGRVVELPNKPGDQDNVNRDDLVFPEGTMHLLSTMTGGSFSLSPRNCMVKATFQSTAEITGGTGQFADATGSFPTNTARVVGLAARDPDGSCSMTKPFAARCGEARLKRDAVVLTSF